MAKNAGLPTGNPTVDQAITNAAGGDPKTLEYLVVIADIESGYDPNAHNPSGAAGLYQFMPKTAKDYHLSDPYNASESAKAAVRLMKDNADYLKSKLGREPTNGELYLAHQQGCGGAVDLLKNPNACAADLVGSEAVLQNGGKSGMTAGEFSQIWLSTYNKKLGAAAASSGITLPSTESVSTVVADLNAHGEKALATQLQIIENTYKAQNGQITDAAKESVVQALKALKNKRNDVYAQYGVTKTDFGEMLALHMGPHTAAAILKATDPATKLNQISLTSNGKTIKPVEATVNGFLKEMREAGVQIPAEENFNSLTAGKFDQYANNFYQLEIQKAASLAQRADKTGKDGLTTDESKQMDFMKMITQAMGPEMGGLMQLVVMLVGFMANGKEGVLGPNLAPKFQDQGQSASTIPAEAQAAVQGAKIPPLPAAVPATTVPAKSSPAVAQR